MVSPTVSIREQKETWPLSQAAVSSGDSLIPVNSMKVINPGNVTLGNMLE